VALEALSMTSSSPDQGWITYEVRLAVRNTSEAPVLLSIFSGDIISADTSLATQPGALAAALRTSSAQVSTDQNHPYPADVNTLHLDSLLIPAGMTVFNPTSSRTNGFGLAHGEVWSFDSFSATFKVPELLHPTQLTIDPGIAYNGISTAVALDLTSLTQQSTRVVNPNVKGAPLEPFQSGPLEVSIAAAPGSIVSYHPLRNRDSGFVAGLNLSPEDVSRLTPQNGGEFLAIVDATIKNTDITGDQSENLDVSVNDGYGTTCRTV
jgi:hypothetical protein